MTDPEQDDVFEAYLKRRAVLPALDNELEPPAALDEAVLAKARDAIQPAAPSSARTRLGRPARWAVPVALAATILLCLSVVMNISLNTNRPRPSATLERAAAARADSKASALSNATAESNAAAGVDAQGSGAAQDRFANNGERPQSVSGEIASGEVVLPRAKVAGAQAPRAPVEVESASSANASSADAADATSALSTMTTMTASTARGAPTSGTRATQSPTDEPRVAADKAVMMAKRAGVAAPEYTPAPEAARAAGRAEATPEALVAPAADQAAAKSRAAAHPADPKTWLQQIEALRASGKKDQADAEMRRFKAAFPDYAIPVAPPAAPARPGSPTPDLPK